MKRMILPCLIVMMLVCAACAETRHGVVYLEGEPEPVTETLYETPWGFSFWYDAETFEVIETVNNNEVTNICLSAKEGFACAPRRPAATPPSRRLSGWWSKHREARPPCCAPSTASHGGSSPS